MVISPFSSHLLLFSPPLFLISLVLGQWSPPPSLLLFFPTPLFLISMVIGQWSPPPSPLPTLLPHILGPWSMVTFPFSSPLLPTPLPHILGPWSMVNSPPSLLLFFHHPPSSISSYPSTPIYLQYPFLLTIFNFLLPFPPHTFSFFPSFLSLQIFSIHYFNPPIHFLLIPFPNLFSFNLPLPYTPNLRIFPLLSPYAAI